MNRLDLLLFFLDEVGVRVGVRLAVPPEVPTGADVDEGNSEDSFGSGPKLHESRALDKTYTGIERKIGKC